MSTLKKGKEGEKLASQFLESKGYKILEYNYRYRRGEIDLIVEKEKTLVFVEVKYKSYPGFGFPEEAVNNAKEKMIITTADQYIYEKNWDGPIRFDIISILANSHETSIEHFEDAFY